ncbi:MAG: hypothetical protein F6J93_17870 [Oscillatoria sp. SIO1A7]|nr:hypothetical protein [Oscillatoria sp. SIO1A7]
MPNAQCPMPRGEGFHSNWRLPGDRHDEYAETPLTLGLSGSRKRIGKWDEFSPHPTPHTLHPTPHTLHPTPYTPHPMPHAQCPMPHSVTLLNNLGCDC